MSEPPSWLYAPTLLSHLQYGAPRNSQKRRSRKSQAGMNAAWNGQMRCSLSHPQPGSLHPRPKGSRKEGRWGRKGASPRPPAGSSLLLRPHPTRHPGHPHPDSSKPPGPPPPAPDAIAAPSAELSTSSSRCREPAQLVRAALGSRASSAPSSEPRGCSGGTLDGHPDTHSPLLSLRLRALQGLLLFPLHTEPAGAAPPSRGGAWDRAGVEPPSPEGRAVWEETTAPSYCTPSIIFKNSAGTERGSVNGTKAPTAPHPAHKAKDSRVGGTPRTFPRGSPPPPRSRRPHRRSQCGRRCSCHRPS